MQSHLIGTPCCWCGEPIYEDAKKKGGDEEFPKLVALENGGYRIPRRICQEQDQGEQER